MGFKKQHLISMIFVALFVLSGCADDSSEGSTPGDSSTGSDEGSALFTYKYVVDTPPNLVIVVQPDIQATMQRDEDNVGRFNVDGYVNSTAYMTLLGTNAGNDCHVQCDVPIWYTVKGKLLQTLSNGKLVCSIEVTYEAGYLQEDINRYGDCPDLVIDTYPCRTVIESFLFPETVVFSKGDTEAEIVSAPGVTHIVGIKNVVFPDSVACEW